ncbi:MAG: tetratricopeptide repeat protein [marine benthic group bacterium]|nr:tetratricopeptide repeat protein [Gemmatimonadota bacterium]
MSEVPFYQRFFAELKRRRVFRVMAVYGAVGFVILQVVELLVPALLLPEWTYRLIALLLIVGFPIAIVLAWAFESTPEGMKRTDEATEAELAAIAAAPPAKRWPAGIAALVATGLFAGAVWMGLRSSGPGDGGVAEAVPTQAPPPVAASEGTPTSAESGLASPDTPARQSVAVLPFADLAGTDDSRAFALGLHDDLMTQLTRVPDLKVTSRTSVMAYEDQSRPVREIADELGVGSIVEGGVRTSGGRVRLNVQLIDPATDEHLWAETYDRELTAETVFEIQGEIARAVAMALEAELSPETGQALGAVLTENIDAWNAYHEGKLTEERSNDPAVEYATVAAFERAVELDPGFVAAWARLVRAQAWLIRRGLENDTMPARRSLSRLQELDPGGADALFAEGVYRYYAQADYDSALEAFTQARSARPGDPEIMQHAAWVMRRLGRWDSAVELVDRAIQLDPRNATLVWNQALNHYRLRDYETGRRLFDVALELDPLARITGIFLVELRLFTEGDSAAARRTLAAGRGMEAEGQRVASQFWLSYMDRDFPAAIEHARRMTGEPEGIASSATVLRLMPRETRLAYAYRMMGAEDESKAWADSAVRRARAELDDRPTPDPRDKFGVAAVAHGALAVALAIRDEPGDAEEAVRHAEQGVRLHGYDVDAVDSDLTDWNLLQTYVLTGSTDEAFSHMEELLSRPSVFGLGDLKLDPLYDGLRDDPRFPELVRRLERQTER